MSTMPTIFESAEEFSSPEISDELITALAAGWWWAIVEASELIFEHHEYGYLISRQCGETVETGETSCPTSLIFSDASEKAHSQHSDVSDATVKTTPQGRQKMTQGAPLSSRSTQGAPVPAKTTGQWRKRRPGKYEEGELKTTKQWRQQNTKAPVPDRSKQGECMLVRSQQNSHPAEKDLTSSLVFSDASEKDQRSSFSNGKMAMDQRRKWRQKKPQIASVPAASPKEAPVPIGSQKRGKLRIPEHLIEHLTKAALETPMPIQSPLQRAPVAASKELISSSNGAPMPDKIGDGPKLKTPEPLRQELLQQKPQAFLQGPPMPDNISKRQKQKIPEPEIAPVCCAQGAHVINKISERSAEASDNAGLCQAPPQKLCLELRGNNHPAPLITTSQPNPGTPNRLQSRSQPTRKRPLDSAGVDWSPPRKKQWMEIKVNSQQSDPGSLDQIDDLCSMFAKCCVISDRTMPDNISKRQKQKIPEPEIAPVCCAQGAPVINKISERSTEASDNAGLCQAPPQKLCLELRRNNHPAPQITTSQPNPGTPNRLQSRSQATQKRPLDSAGVDWSPPRKKQRLEIKVNSQQSDPGSLDQIDDLCSMFAKCCVISDRTMPDNISKRQKQKIPEPEIAPVCCAQGAPVINKISERSTEASDNAGLCQAPPQKLCVELRRNNHPAPLITTSQPNPGTPNRLQSRSQATRKRALDSAEVDWSPPPKKSSGWKSKSTV